jgi:uncharacterized integral membrane protein (TIGR00697 family)
MKTLSAIWLSMLLVVVSITATMAGQKVIELGDYSIAASWLLQPMIPVLTIMLTLWFGQRYARNVMITNALCYLLAMLAIKVAIIVPADTSWVQQVWYAQILSISWHSIILMLLWLLAGQFFISWIVSKLFTLKQAIYFGLFPVIAMFFIMSLLVSNLTTQKVAHLIGITVDVGTLFFPITYIFNNIFTEVYGYKRSRVVIWGGLVGNLLMVLILQSIVWAPSASSWHQQTVYSAIVGNVPRIVLASTLAFFFGEFINSYALAKLKILTSGKYLWIRTISSTLVGVAVDSLVFSFVAFYGTLPVSVVLAIAGWEYVLKVGYEVLATPITIRVIRWIKQREHTDRYDYKTRFNPFFVRDVQYD